jgi:hypothetical protein
MDSNESVMMLFGLLREAVPLFRKGRVHNLGEVYSTRTCSNDVIPLESKLKGNRKDYKSLMPTASRSTVLSMPNMGLLAPLFLDPA